MRNDARGQHQDDHGQNDKNHHAEKVFLELGHDLVLLDDMHHVERGFLHGRDHEGETLPVVIGFFETQHLAVHQRVDDKVVVNHGEESRKAVLVHLAEAGFVREERKDVVAAVLDHQRNAAFVLGGRSQRLADLQEVDIFGDDALDLLVPAEDREREGHHELLALGLDVRAGNGETLVTGGLEVPSLGAEFR